MINTIFLLVLLTEGDALAATTGHYRVHKELVNFPLGHIIESKRFMCTGGSKGGSYGCAPPRLGPISFISLQFSGKIWPNNRLALPLSGKSWIRH